MRTYIVVLCVALQLVTPFLVRAISPFSAEPSNEISASLGTNVITGAVFYIYDAPYVDIPANQVVCDQAATVSVTFTGTGEDYSWENNYPSIGLPESGTGNIHTFSAINSEATPIVATITVTPYDDLDIPGDVITFTFTVNPIPGVSAAPFSQTICPGATINNIVITNTNAVEGTTFSWIRNNVIILTDIDENGTGPIISGVLNSTAPSTLQSTIFTITASANGCTSSPAEASVTVGDIDSPGFACPTDQNVNLNASCELVVPNLIGGLTGTDNCGTIAFSQNPAAGIVLSSAHNQTHIVTITASDGNGNTTDCTATLIGKDVTPPIFTSCPGNLSLNSPEASCANTHTPAHPLFTDNCGVVTSLTWVMTGANTGSSAPTGINYVPVTNFNIGVTNITYTATDVAGNSVQCAFTVTVTDNSPPDIEDCPADITVYTGPGRLTCNQVATWIEPTATDNCTPAGSLVWTKSHLPGATFPVGTTLVTYNVRDAAGNTSVCNFNVTVIDDTPPTITCPVDVVISTEPNICSASGVNLGTPITADNCAIANVSNNAPATFPLGTTEVIWTVTDSNGNTMMCTQNVTVADTQPPITPSIGSVNRQCEYNLLPADYPTTTDNCDGIIIGIPSVTFPYTTIGTTIIEWTFTDNSGNSTTANQIVTINDTQSPAWVTFPGDLILSCGDDTSPASTGAPTATDNCSDVIITYADNVVPGNCPARSVITRSWRATDATGNYTARNQRITIDDTTPPVITCTSFTNFNPDDVPLIDDYFGVTVSDNCSAPANITLIPISEQYEFDANLPGFCPTFLTRVYRAVDECGNIAQCVQTYDFSFNPNCELCEEGTRFFQHIFTDPDELWEIEEVRRQGNCCSQSGSPPLRCVAYNFYLHEDAVGVIFEATEGAKPASGNFHVRLDCGTPAPLNQVLCLEGGRFYTVTFCKSGNNPNAFSIQSIGGAAAPDELIVRADEECGGDITVTGLDTSETITWSVVSPNDQSLLGYLSCIDCLNPTFTPDAQAPPSIIYRVCGTLSGDYRCDGEAITDCADVIVTVLPPIEISFDIDLDNICEDDMLEINASISPSNSTYSYAWYDEYDGAGNLLSTSQTWEPLAQGEYSLVVTDLSNSGVVCNKAIFNFEIVYDYIGPTVVVPPDMLVIECNASNAELMIQNWLASATAFDHLSSSIPVEHDYQPFIHSCNLDVTVRFWAEDVCGNENSETAVIRIVDTQAPVFTFCPPATTNQNDENECLINELVLEAPIAIDNCGTVNLTWEKTGATTGSGAGTATGPFNVGVTLLTYTATDACGNTAICLQEVTIIDVEPPTLTCPLDVIVTTPPPNCELQVLIIDPPVVVENCPDLGTTLSWEKSGATTGTGSGDVNGTLFNVGTTIVTYTITDLAGNFSQCSFSVTVNDEVPPLVINCPGNETVYVEPGVCEIWVDVDEPEVIDECGEIVTISHNSPYGISSDNASGTYPAGVHEVTWTFTDASGNSSFCYQTITVIDTIPPSISCPTEMVEDLITDGGCTLINANIPNPFVDDNCGIEYLTYVLNGATTGNSPATGINYVSAAELSIGITTVTYTLTDVNGNTASCSFTVWIRNLAAPQFSVSCPADVNVNVDAGLCHADIIVPAPVIDNPCNELYTITNDFSGRTSNENASGIFPVGTTQVTWTIIDASGNITICVQTITVVDNIAPELVCPPSFELEADWGMDYASDVTLEPPVYDDNCEVEVLSWVMTGATTGNSPVTGINIVAVHDFNAGITVITYTATDPSGNVSECSFEVTILARPVIECPSDILGISTDPGVCQTALDPGEPVLLSGAQPVNWSWEMTGATTASGTGRPIAPTPYAFNMGETTITWIAINVSGSDHCVQIIEVVDNEPPDFEPPADEINCVEDIFLAIYNPGGTYEENTDLTEPRPNYFLLTDGNSMLHLFGLSDNCNNPTNLTISWTIHFAPPLVPGDPWYPAEVSDATITGTGQIDGPLYFPVGDNLITWTVTDESGNETTRSVTLTVTPRPHIIDNF